MFKEGYHPEDISKRVGLTEDEIIDRFVIIKQGLSDDQYQTILKKADARASGKEV